MSTMVESTSIPMFVVTAAVGAVVLLLVLLCNLLRRDATQTVNDGLPLNTDSHDMGDGKHESGKADVKKNGAVAGGKKRDRRTQQKKDAHSSVFTHAWLASTLKGHAAPILALDFSPNGKQLVTCAEDRTIYLWSTQELNQKEHKWIRSNVEFDHLTSVKFCPDNKALIGSLFTAETVRVFKISKKADGTSTNFQAVFDFEKKHVAEIISLGIASTGKYIMTCSKDTQIRIWNLKGEVLASIETHQVNNSFAAVSPCGRFVASAGFTSDVKVWEICFDKTGNFREVARAFELTGHSAGIHHFDFSIDSCRMATVSKDGTWKFWDTDIEYQKNQDPCILRSTECAQAGRRSIIALAPDARTVAIATGSSISVYNTSSGVCAQTFTDVHGCDISGMQFDNTSRFLLSCGDKHVQVLHNVVGHRATITELEERRRGATQAMKERIDQQIRDARATMASIGLTR